MAGDLFRTVFPKRKSLIGMLHLAGGDARRVQRAREELEVYAGEGMDGVIFENYHCTMSALERVLECFHGMVPSTLAMGINVLGNPTLGLEWAQKYGIRFVQFDNMNSTPRPGSREYLRFRVSNPTAVLGGVQFKYQGPSGNSLAQDITEAKMRCEAIVTTGDGTGAETPLDKLVHFRGLMGSYPLIVGAGVNAKNAYAQLEICDGTIVGSYFKDGNTENPVIPGRVRELV